MDEDIKIFLKDNIDLLSVFLREFESKEKKGYMCKRKLTQNDLIDIRRREEFRTYTYVCMRKRI